MGGDASQTSYVDLESVRPVCSICQTCRPRRYYNGVRPARIHPRDPPTGVSVSGWPYVSLYSWHVQKGTSSQRTIWLLEHGFWASELSGSARRTIRRGIVLFCGPSVCYSSLLLCWISDRFLPLVCCFSGSPLRPGSIHSTLSRDTHPAGV